jgi:hypothetical protein
MGHLGAYARVLPHAALTALPWLSYLTARSLGRWKDDDKKKKQVS